MELDRSSNAVERLLEAAEAMGEGLPSQIQYNTSHAMPRPQKQYNRLSDTIPTDRITRRSADSFPQLSAAKNEAGKKKLKDDRDSDHDENLHVQFGDHNSTPSASATTVRPGLVICQGMQDFDK